ncbi:MAG: hypothetical protein JNM24_17370 [Bdellovibrionaceae bacterium]|nr:hypothetical protein [Pseudobdellovibrionaceae bacterium]
MKRFSSFFITMFLISANADQLERISRPVVNLNDSKSIYLSPGLISVVEFPDPIIEVRVGDPGSLKPVISQVSPKELTLIFKASNSVATNLIVRSGKRVFVMDVIPSKSRHQDYVKVRGVYSFVPHGNSIHRPITKSKKPKIEIEVSP